MRIPVWICSLDVKLTAFRIDVWIVYIFSKVNPGPGVDFIVFGWEVDREFENCIRVKPSTEENDSVEGSKRVKRREDVDSGGGVLFEVFVFDGDFVVSQCLFAV